jgi:ankyrin repeat protein
MRTLTDLDLTVYIRFLLARMHIDLLATRSVLGKVEWTLKNLPEGLKELDKAYDDVITRILAQDEEDVAMAEQILTWLFYAVRPLTLEELRHALAVKLAVDVDPNATQLDDDFLPYEEVIVSVCAGIATLHPESNTIAFVHYTTKEYFKRRLERKDVELILYMEADIANTCLGYLLFERKEFDQFLVVRTAQGWITFERYRNEHCPTWDLKTLYPLYHYAARHWGDHAHGRLQQTTKDLALKFVRQNSAVAASLQVVAEQDYENKLFPTQVSGLCVASFFGLEELVLLLIEDGDDVAARNEDDWTALHMAAERGHGPVVRLLLEKGADIKARTNEPNNTNSGATALHRAAGAGHSAVMEILLKNGAEIDAVTFGHETALYWAVISGHVVAIELLLDYGADIEAISSSKFTPLCRAAWEGEEAAVKLLIEKGANLHAKANPDKPLLHLAAEGGSEEVVRLLLEKGAQVNSLDNMGRSALFYAAFSRKQPEGIIRLLMEKGADVSMKDNRGETALHAASYKSSYRGSESVVRLLLERGSDVTVKNNSGETVLHKAAEYGTEVVMWMRLENGADVAAKSILGQTALHIAAKRGHAALVRLLKDNGADVTMTDDSGLTALHMAAWNGHEEVTRLLLDHTGKESRPEALLATAQLHNVAKTGDEIAARLLLDEGADVAAEDRHGRTTLCIAAKNGHVALSKVLLEEGARINAGSYPYTAVYYAAQAGHEEVVRLLIENGANINLGWGEPLLDAIRSVRSWNRGLDIVKLLLEGGADVSAKDRWGNSALHIAAGLGHEPLVRVLLEKGAAVWDKDYLETALQISTEKDHGAVSQLVLESINGAESAEKDT